MTTANLPNTKQTLPRPETTRALLISAGYRKPVATVHFYKETRLAELDDGSLVFEHLFACFKTGTVRRWGIENADRDAELN